MRYSGQRRSGMERGRDKVGIDRRVFQHEALLLSFHYHESISGALFYRNKQSLSRFKPA
jgi:hypothetical protein